MNKKISKEHSLSRKLRRQKYAAPSQAFRYGCHEVFNILKEVKKLGVTDATFDHLLKTNVIYLVTLFEVYFRDILAVIFEFCVVESYDLKLDKLHERKYKISEVVRFSSGEANPLDIVVNSINFQSWNAVEEVFSLLLSVKSFKHEAKQVQWTISEELPSADTQGIQLQDEDFLKLERLFAIRHALVHDPNPNLEIKEDEIIYDLLLAASSVVISCNTCLTSFIELNLKTGAVMRA